jgi:stage V sporulation protein AB
VAVVLGAVTWTWLDLMGWSFTFTPWLTSFVGLLMGAFVGTVAAALAEVLNVFPILTRRLHMERVLSWLIAAVLLGKVFGSLFEWLVFRT